MTFKALMLSAGLALASMVGFGCGNTDVDGHVAETELALESESQDEEHGYGYEMLPLQLHTNAVAPMGSMWLPDGRVAPEEVVRQATDRIDALRACYATALATDPTLSGEIHAICDFRVDGALRSVRLENNSALDPAFADCVTTALGTMQLPPSNYGWLHVVYPIALDLAVLASGQ